MIDDVLVAIKNAEANEGKEINEAMNEIMTTDEDKKQDFILNSASLRETSTITEKNHLENIYKICELEIVLSSSPNDFLDFANTLKIKNQINRVLEIEAPIKKTY